MALPKPEISLEMQIGLCLCFLRVGDILRNSKWKPGDAMQQLHTAISEAEAKLDPDAWGHAKFLHETILNEVRNLEREQELRKKNGYKN